MGGCLTLMALAKGQADRFAGCVLSAPMFGVRTGKTSPAAARMMARLNSLFGRAGGYVQNDPGRPFDDTFEGNPLTHDRRRYARQHAQLKACPDLALGAPTWGWLDFAFQATDELARAGSLDGVKLPVVVCSASEDKLVDNASQKAVTDRLPDGRFVPVAGAEHEILMETDDIRASFWAEFDALAEKTAPSRS
jgi:lysophospholipase